MSAGRGLFLRARLRGRGGCASVRGDGRRALRRLSDAFEMIGVGLRAFVCGRCRCR